MLFNSIAFFIFLSVVFSLYWFLFGRTRPVQNIVLLFSSYFFYACWDWRFLFLLIFSTLLDYVAGIKIYKAGSPRIAKLYLWISVVINLGFLCFFKYFNFFITNVNDSVNYFGFTLHVSTLQIILPVGISFYTFHGLSYVIDIYKRKIEPERNALTYALFVSFFPLLVAGPIERASHLLPQLKKNRSFSYSHAVDGLRQIVWGLFKKIVIADQCAPFVNQIFGDYQHASGSTLFVGALLFSLQIYSDFSGYSDIAIGVAKLFGIDLFRNFAYPYFSRDFAEFWRRWHISLSSWFRDYLYIPLGGGRNGQWKKIRNVCIVFLISGFWHGANWTFIIWGGINAILFLCTILLKPERKDTGIVGQGKLLPSPKEALAILFTFLSITLVRIFFRAGTVSQAFAIVKKIFSRSMLTAPSFPFMKDLGPLGMLFAFFITVEWLGREEPYPIAKLELNFPTVARWSFYFLLVTAIVWYHGSEQQFIYFKF